MSRESPVSHRKFQELRKKEDQSGFLGTDIAFCYTALTVELALLVESSLIEWFEEVAFEALFASPASLLGFVSVFADNELVFTCFEL